MNKRTTNRQKEKESKNIYIKQNNVVCTFEKFEK